MVLVNQDMFKSVIVAKEDGSDLRIDEGMRVKFVTESGEMISGTLTKISGKGEKTKLQIVPYGAQKEEIWALVVMAEGTLGIDEEEAE